MEYIRVCNLRCLADTQRVAIKPITLLVGANSSGKSSFLRVFPLLRQSTETRTLSGLLLNEGDVNFGFFPEVLHRNAEPAELKLEFGFNLKSGFHQGASVNRFLAAPLPIKCELIYGKRNKDLFYPYIQTVRLTLDEKYACDIIEITAKEDGTITKFKVNEYSIEDNLSLFRLSIRGGLVPSIVGELNSKNSGNSPISDDGIEVGSFKQKLIAATYDRFHGLASDDTRWATLTSIRIGSPEKMLEMAKTANSVSSWTQNVKKWTIDTPQFLVMRNLLLANTTIDLLAAVNRQVSQFAWSVNYFAPVRASVQRDYLNRDVQVRNVDPSGLNVAMVLASLGQHGQVKFREWMRNHFGFEVFAQGVSDGARVAIRMKEEGSGAEFNLADMGFGFSQMLPFLVQLWNMIENETGKNSRLRRVPFPPELLAIPPSFIVAIEQPELHLHPALQARLMDLFIKMIRLSREKNIPVSFILETHSPTIIERIGQSIEANCLDSNDVQVLLFEKDCTGVDPNTATMRPALFDSTGVLSDWPFGFLSAPPLPISPSSSMSTLEQR